MVQNLFNHYLAQTAGKLSGARRVAMMLLATLLFTLTAQTAWAQGDFPIEFRLVDSDYNDNYDWTVTINEQEKGKAETVPGIGVNGTNFISVSLPEGAYVESIDIVYQNSNDEPIHDSRGDAGSYNNIGNSIEFVVNDVLENHSVNVTFNVRYPRYTVKFNANDGSDSMYDQTFVVGVSQNLSNCSFTREGYTFAGWAESENGNAVYTDGKSVKDLAGEGQTKNLYATWSSGGGVTYAVTFDKQGGSGGTSSVDATYNASMPPIEVPTLTNSAFDGYFTQTNGQGTKYYNADGSSAKTYDLTEATTLYAKWVEKTYTVTLVANGGSGGTNSVTVKYGESMPAITVPTRTGYTFMGYYGDNGNGYAYYSSNGNSARTYDLTTNTSLYARWTVNTYTVNLDPHEGSGGTTSVTVTYGAAMPSATMPTRDGYTFGGYYTGQDGGGTKYYNADGTSARVCDLTGTVTLYAKWTANEYTVTFDQQGGSGPSSVTATYGSDMHPLNPVPSRIGYEFVGYYTEVNGGGVKYYNADGTSAHTWDIEEATTLYAYWKKDLSNEDITIEIPAQTYNGSELTPVVAVRDNGSVVSDEHYTITLPEGRTNAGDYTIEIHAKEGSTEYVGETGATFIISRKAVTITADNDSKTYDGTPLTKNTFTATALESGDTHDFTVVMTSESTITDVGTQPNAIAFVDGVEVNTGVETAVGNYLVTTANGTLTINPITENVTVTITEHSNSDEIVYNGQEHTVTGYDVDISNTLYTEDDFTFSGNAEVKGTNAGTYEMELKPEDFTNTNQNFSNVTFTITDGALTISKAPLTVTANNRSIFYGNAAANDGVTYSGFVNNEDENVLEGTLTYTYSNAIGAYGEDNDAPGEYDITPSGLNAANYAITFVKGKLTVEAITVKVKVVDIANGEDLEGAHVQVLNTEENFVAEWNSGTESHEVGGLKAGKTYTLHETVAPDGYVLPTDYTFTIATDGTVTTTGTKTTDEDGNTVLLVENSKTKVRVSVIDTADGEELEGGHVQVIEAKGTDNEIVVEWTSTTESHVIEGLKTGVEYTIRETVAPEGYVLSTDCTFTIDEDGKVTYSGEKNTDEDGNTVLLVENSRTHVEISVVDTHDGAKLAGGHVQVKKSNGDLFEEWDPTTENHVIEGLKTGEEYTIQETIAPNSYALSSDYTFTIAANGTVTYTGTKTTDESGNTVLLVKNDMIINPSVAINWSDFSDNYRVRPASVTVTLSANDEDVKTVTLDATHNWTATEAGLRKYDNDNKEINYSWTIADEIGCYEQHAPQVDGTATTFDMHLMTSGNCGQPGNENAVNWSYNTTSETITISGSGPMMYYNSVQDGENWNNGAPWKAFANEIENVVISNGITYVGSNTFAHCPHISSVTLPTNQQLYEIGPGAFGDCTGLTSIDLPMSVNKIYEGAFAGCSNLKTVTLGYGDATHVVNIGRAVFPVTATILVPDETAYAAYMNAAIWNGTATGEGENTTDYTSMLAPSTITLAGNTSGWTTYCHKYNVSYSVEDGAAYTVSGINDSNVQTATAQYVAPYTPTLVYKENGGDITLTAVPTTATQVVPNNYDGTTGLVTQTDDGFTFVGATTADVADCITAGQSYALYDGEFLKIDDSTLPLPAHRCMLTLNASNSARRLSIGDGETTNITTTDFTDYTDKAGAWYTLDGRKLNGKPTTKGLYIYNERKVVVK